MHYVVVTSGMLSGMGKGVTMSSLAANIQSLGVAVTVVKLDSYLNQNAGSMSPYEHGEVFVLEDGSEVDQDFGEYERVLGIKLTGDHSITGGKVLRKVLDKEMNGLMAGKTVQYIPHVRDEIKDQIIHAASLPVRDAEKPEICFVEVGGSVSAAESTFFFSALEELGKEVGRENIIYILLDMVLEVYGTQKTKPIQGSVAELRQKGIVPDLLFCRAQGKVHQSTKNKIAVQCCLPENSIFEARFLESVADLPLLFEDHPTLDFILQRFAIQKRHTQNPRIALWKGFYKRPVAERTVRLVVVGKYADAIESYTSMQKAIKHACIANNTELDLVFLKSETLEDDCLLLSGCEPAEKQPKTEPEGFETLRTADAVIVAGGHGVRGLQGKIATCEYARKNKLPYLGICLGLQVMLIEFARNVLGLRNANSTEFDPNTEDPVVWIVDEEKALHNSGTMNLGAKKTEIVAQDSLMSRIYAGAPIVEERYRHRYEVNNDYIERLEENGMRLCGVDPASKRPTNLEITDHPFMFATQSHPEFTSSITCPSKPYVALINAAVARKYN
ncbi:MAG: CTP synthase [Amphiamblys sp. WSBS2006]|nr:MAG: CTP synthase [Amphiamblys sp. WSBS2006]